MSETLSMDPADPTDDATQILTPTHSAPATNNGASNLPRRTQRLVQAIFLLLGIGVLVPWNAFISAKSYYVSRRCQQVGDAPDNGLESTIALVYNLSSVTCLILMIASNYVHDQKGLGIGSPDRVAESDGSRSEPENSIKSSSHAYWTVMLALGVLVIVFCTNTVLVWCTTLTAADFWSMTLLSLVMSGIGSALASAGVVAAASALPSEIALNPFLSGQAMGGVAVAVANFGAAVTQSGNDYRQQYCHDDTYNERVATTNDSCLPYTRVDRSVGVYFGLATLVLAACLVGYTYVYHLVNSNSAAQYEIINNYEPGLAPDSVESTPRIGVEMMPDAGRGHQDYSDEVAPSPTIHVQSSVTPKNETLDVLRIVRTPAITVYLVFVVTLAVFPGMTSNLRSVRQCRSHWRLFNDLYTPASFVLFNLGDLTGRLWAGSMPRRQQSRWSGKLVQASTLRVIFLPLLLTCASNNHDALFLGDLSSLIVQLAFAVSNGMLASLAFTHAPSLLQTSKMQGRSSEILTFALMFGLLTGSVLSFPVARLA